MDGTTRRQSDVNDIDLMPLDFASFGFVDQELRQVTHGCEPLWPRDAFGRGETGANTYRRRIWAQLPRSLPYAGARYATLACDKPAEHRPNAAGATPLNLFAYPEHRPDPRQNDLARPIRNRHLFSERPRSAARSPSIGGARAYVHAARLAGPAAQASGGDPGSAGRPGVLRRGSQAGPGKADDRARRLNGALA